VTVLLPVHNGAAWIEQKLRSILDLDYPRDLLQVLVISDGSDDGTEEAVRRFASQGVELVSLPRGGKAAALNEGMRRATGEILLFTDVRQELDRASLGALVSCFADPRVGVVSGELVIRQGSTLEEANVGVYWRYEKWIRKHQSQIDSIMGATGCIYAMRASLAAPMPEETILDDVVLPLGAFFQGYRLILDGRARAYDSPTSLRSEFRRKCGRWPASIRPSAGFRNCCFQETGCCFTFCPTNWAAPAALGDAAGSGRQLRPSRLLENAGPGRTSRPLCAHSARFGCERQIAAQADHISGPDGVRAHCGLVLRGLLSVALPANPLAAYRIALAGRPRGARRPLTGGPNRARSELPAAPRTVRPSPPGARRQWGGGAALQHAGRAGQTACPTVGAPTACPRCLQRAGPGRPNGLPHGACSALGRAGQTARPALGAPTACPTLAAARRAGQAKRPAPRWAPRRPAPRCLQRAGPGRPNGLPTLGAPTACPTVPAARWAGQAKRPAHGAVLPNR